MHLLCTPANIGNNKCLISVYYRKERSGFKSPQLHQMMIRVLPDKSGEVRKARIPPRFAGFFVPVAVREHPAKSGIYWYTFRYTLKCMP